MTPLGRETQRRHTHQRNWLPLSALVTEQPLFFPIHIIRCRKVDTKGGQSVFSCFKLFPAVISYFLMFPPVFFFPHFPVFSCFSHVHFFVYLHLPVNLFRSFRLCPTTFSHFAVFCSFHIFLSFAVCCCVVAVSVRQRSAPKKK